ncbi:hypothetical protein EDB82DRAFT_490075 [Fusarium venenatum]|uniref:uncharacterized protein n=1 Tax=Fusarium venenatum TaxID=56646 RepID=UPI001D7B2FA0|nr:hypothetical protein EDB82DRAFT_490075 [Fusarium venenatum]
MAIVKSLVIKSYKMQGVNDPRRYIRVGNMAGSWKVDKRYSKHLSPVLLQYIQTYIHFKMLCSKLSYSLTFFFWSITLEAAPAMDHHHHHHRHGNHHLQSLHAERAALLHRTRSHSHSHHESPQIVVQELQQPSESLPALVAPYQELDGHSVERLTV